MASARSLTLALTLAVIVLDRGDGSEARRAEAQSVAPSPSRSTTRPPVHRTPEGWRFTWPKGDPAKGRQVFQKLECYSCHEVRGERFPAPSDRGRVGPELSVMGRLHPPEYFAEAIINPGAVVEPNRGYGSADGSSKMPAYGESLTVQETIDLVAYLRQLRPPAAATPGPNAPRGHTTH